MLRVITVMVTLAGLLLLAVQGAGQDLISPEQAKEAVRAFEGNPNLEFETVKLETETEGLPPEVPQPWWYELEGKENYPKGRRRWDVDARTGEVTWAYYPDAAPATRSEQPFGPLTKEDCRQIAENFARAKYAGFDGMNFELIDEYWTGEGWEFEWRQILAYRALGVNFVRIEVNPADGRIQVYQSLRVEQQQPPRQPQITQEQAIEISKQSLKLVTVYGSEATLGAMPDGSVFWEIAMGGELPSGDYKGGIVYINAETGEVTDIVYESGEFPQRASLKEAREYLKGKEKWWMWIVVSVALLFGITIILRLKRRIRIFNRGGF